MAEITTALAATCASRAMALGDTKAFRWASMVGRARALVPFHGIGRHPAHPSVEAEDEALAEAPIADDLPWHVMPDPTMAGGSPSEDDDSATTERRHPQWHALSGGRPTMMMLMGAALLMLGVAFGGVVGVVAVSSKMTASTADSPSDDVRSPVPNDMISAPPIRAASIDRLAMASGGLALDQAAVVTEPEPPWGAGGLGGAPPEPLPSATMGARLSIDGVAGRNGEAVEPGSPQEASGVGAQVPGATMEIGSAGQSTASLDW